MVKDDDYYEGLVMRVAGALHDDWRTDYVNDPMNRYHDGTLKKKWGNIEKLTFDELPDEWKYENIAAARVVCDLVRRKNEGEILEYGTVGDAVHNAWLARNPLACAHPVYKKPFCELSPREQLKDVNQYVIALAIDDRTGA